MTCCLLTEGNCVQAEQTSTEDGEVVALQELGSQGGGGGAGKLTVGVGAEAGRSEVEDRVDLDLDNTDGHRRDGCVDAEGKVDLCERTRAQSVSRWPARA